MVGDVLVVNSGICLYIIPDFFISCYLQGPELSLSWVTRYLFEGCVWSMISVVKLNTESGVFMFRQRSDGVFKP